MNIVKMSNFVDFSKEKEQQSSIDNYMVGKKIGGASVNTTTNKRRVEASIVNPEKATCAMYTRS